MKNYLKWLIPLTLFIIIAPFTPWLDIHISKLFFVNHSFSKGALTRFFYEYGTWPAWIFAFSSLLIIILGFFTNFWSTFRKEALLYLLTLGLGGGLITNIILKQYWQRPRPVQIYEFGGFTNYHPFWSPLIEYTIEPGRSFPCGHCTMGFAFFAFCFIGIRRNNKPLFYFGLFFSLILGIGLSIARIAGGGHFFSDTLASALIMWLSLLLVDHILYKDPI